VSYSEAAHQTFCMNLFVLPNLVALTVLVTVFWAISRKARTERLGLWLVGWILILLHFADQFVQINHGLWGRITAVGSLVCLVMATVAFLISVSYSTSHRKRQLELALATAIPAIAYIIGAVQGAGNVYFYCVIAAAALAPVLACRSHFWQGKLGPLGGISGIAIAAGLAIWAVHSGRPYLGVTIFLTALTLSVAILYWLAYRRFTAGVLTAIGGFVFWSAVFPAAVLLNLLVPSATVDSEVWNIPKYLVAVGMILTLLEDQIATSRYFAYHDELTGLPNRRLLEDRLTKALALADRAGTKVAILQLDLDRFKEVNDTYGHRVGDIALREVVARLAPCIGPGDTLARSGGDEFTVVSDVADAQQAKALSLALESALSAPIRIDGVDVQTGLSIGLALFPDNGSDPDELHAAADQAMYVAKRAARTRPPLQSTSVKSLQPAP
jgi:diguanylate cyclase (GGDEF)-like protein